MTQLDFCDRLLAQGPRRIACADEGAYLAAWTAHAQPLTDDLLSMALMGGLVSDRLAWVFLAGYQAACFDAFANLPRKGWIAYAASEDRKGNPPLPGVTLQDAHLNGTKTWVAAARSVSQIVIKVGSGPEARYLLVPRETSGLTVEAGHTPRFLSDMSQGLAHFHNTPLSMTKTLDSTRIHEFGLLEPLYIDAAFCGFILGSTDEQDLVSLARACLGAIAQTLKSVDTALDRHSLARVDALAQDLLAQLAGNRLHAAGDWTSDQRLITMYSRSLQRRVQGL